MLIILLIEGNFHAGYRMGVQNMTIDIINEKTMASLFVFAVMLALSPYHKYLAIALEKIISVPRSFYKTINYPNHRNPNTLLQL